MAESDHIVTHQLCRRQGNTDYYELTTDYGYADITFENVVSWLCIANVAVEERFRRAGRAKALLGHAASLAEELDVQRIYASLVTRESIDAFSAVFGADAVQVSKRGQYGSVAGAEAYLHVMRY